MFQALQVFNCAVRAYANCLEGEPLIATARIACSTRSAELPWFLFALLFTGLEFPTLAVGSGALWVVGTLRTQSLPHGRDSRTLTALTAPPFTARSSYVHGWILVRKPQVAPPGVGLRRLRSRASPPGR